MSVPLRAGLMLRQFVRRGGPAARASWGIGDQALSSLSNFVLAVAIARSVSVAEFGAFSLAFAAYLVALNVSRALATDPVTIRYSARTRSEWRVATVDATGTSLAIGLIGGAACIGIGVAVGGAVGQALAALGLGLPGLLLQDAWRYAFFAARQGRDAFFNDLVWTLGLAASLGVAFSTGASSVGAYILAWAMGGAAGALFGLFQSRSMPRPMRARAWLREHRDLAPRLAVEGLVISGAQQLTLVLVGLVAGLATVGTVRGGQVLMNALNVATYGIFLVAVPEGVRLLKDSPAALLRLSLAISGGLVGVTFLWTALLLALPDPAGVLLLGETWSSAQRVILPIGIAQAATGIQVGAVVGLRSLAMARRSLPARIFSSSLYLGGGVAGGSLSGAPGAAWGIAVGVSAGSLVWWRQLLRGLAEVRPTPGTASIESSAPRAAQDFEG